MAFVEFTDDTGDLSGVLFPRVYLASSFMKVGMIALVYGKIEERNQRNNGSGKINYCLITKRGF